MRRFLAPIAVAVSLAGCGSAPSAEEAVSNAAGKTSAERTARIVVSFDGSPSVEGAFDFADQEGVLNPHVGAGPAIVTDAAVYTSVDDDLISTSSRKRWLLHSRDDFRPLMIDPFADTPSELLEFLNPAGQAQLVGEGEERGEPVKRYSALLDVQRIARRGADARTDLDYYWPEWETEGVPFQIALDSEGRIRRAELVLTDGEELTVELFDYGVEVDATPPDASKVLTWAEYEKLLRKECESLKKKGLEKTKPHCFSCGVAEGEV
jgi:hypothetical protein